MRDIPSFLYIFHSFFVRHKKTTLHIYCYRQPYPENFHRHGDQFIVNDCVRDIITDICLASCIFHSKHGQNGAMLIWLGQTGVHFVSHDISRHWFRKLIFTHHFLQMYSYKHEENWCDVHINKALKDGLIQCHDICFIEALAQEVQIRMICPGIF